MSTVTADGLDYAGYLRLPELLGAQQPVTPSGDARVHAAEHFFIVVHQASELWLRQVLLDLDGAAGALRDKDPEIACEHLRRAGTVLDLLVRHVDALAALPLPCFAAFRPGLGTASGAQSPQFRDLYRALGMGRTDSPVLAAFLHLVEAHGITLRELYRDCRPSSLFQVAEALCDVSTGVWRWQVVHVQMTARMIGDVSGTGGSSGIPYLERRVAAPFPELWEARGVAHEPGTVRAS